MVAFSRYEGAQRTASKGDVEGPEVFGMGIASIGPVQTSLGENTTSDGPFEGV